MLKKNLGYFALNTWLTVRTRATYRSAAALKLIVNLFVTILYIYLWRAVYGGKETVGGFTLPDMLAHDNGGYRGVFDYACAFGFGCFLLVFKKNMDAFPAALWQQRELISILWFAREFTLPGQDQFGRCL